MWQKRYRQFKDTNWNRTCRKRGSNQKVPPYMSQNVSPEKRPMAKDGEEKKPWSKFFKIQKLFYHCPRNNLLKAN